MLRSTNDIVTKCRDGKLLNDYASLYNTLQNAVKQENRLILFVPQFCYGNSIEHKYIEKWVVVVKRREQTSTIGASKIHIDSLPVICDVAELTTKHCFTFEKTHSLFGICQNKAWIQYTSPLGGECVNVYYAEGLELQGYMHNVKLTDGHHMLRATQKELWVQSGALIKNITVTYLDTPEEIVRMPMSSEKALCSMFGDNHIVKYCVKNKCFFEVNINGDWPIEINETTLKITPAGKKLAELITAEPFKIYETSATRIILTCEDKVITLDREFKIYNVHENDGFDFRGICGDPYSNIFIVDYNLNKICLFNSIGDFLLEVSVQAISGPVDITRDSVGNIWSADSENQVHIFSNL